MDFLYHHTEYGGAQILPSAGGEKDIFYLSIMLLKGKVCANNLTIKASEYRNFFCCLWTAGWCQHRMLKLKIQSNLEFFIPQG